MKSGFELEKAIQSLIRLGKNKDQIKRTLSNDVPDQTLLDETVERVCDAYPDYGLIQFSMKSKIILDKDREDDKLHLYNLINHDVITMDRSRLSSMLSPKLNWQDRCYTCEFVYNPLEPFKLRQKGFIWEFNVYIPPEWQKDYFYSGGEKKIEPLYELPELYDRYFNHLVNEDKPSLNYLLDWAANSIQARNHCMLATIGNQGIGKGVLGNILRELVGPSNYQKTDKRVITKDFNGQLLNKRIVYLDEVKISTVDQENKMKDLINGEVEIERKGLDAKMAANHSSFYFSSNDLDSIRLTSDNRRFSLIELTDNMLINFMDVKTINSLTDPENIKLLGRYLMTRKVDRNKMMKVFVSARTQMVREAGLKDWEEWFIDEYIPKNYTKSIPVKKVSEDVADEFDMQKGPGRGKLTDLQKRFSHLFEIKNIRKDKDDREWCVVIKERSEDEV